MTTSTLLTSLDSESGTLRPARTGAMVWSYLAPWHRRALALIALIAAGCDFYQLQANGYANLYYAAAIRSMLESWHNFYFVSFDPGGFVSVDKPPLGFWIQAASAKLFGYSGFSLLMPEALAGVLSVLMLYLLVRRVFGPPAGLLAALALAITPISVVTNRNNTVDSLLVLAVLVAAYAVSRAVEHGSLRWLLLGAALVGLGFNIKMLQAYLVVPAFAAMYLLGAPLGWMKRLGHLTLAGAALVAVSVSWVLAVDLTPAAARPYIGSSGSNSELALALGYNGVQRLLGNVFRISSGLGGATVTAAAPGGPGGASENGAQGVLRLLNAQLGGQASWLLALGLVGALAAGWGIRPRGVLRTLPRHIQAWRASVEARRAAHLTPQQAALVLWLGWTLTQAVFFSVAGFFHRYYLSMLAPGIAALAGASIVLLWRDYRSAEWRRWLLPVALVATAITQGIILADYAGWNAWMTPLIVGSVLVAAGWLVWCRRGALPVAGVRGAQISTDAAWDDTSDANVATASVPTPPTARFPRWAYAPLLATVLGVAMLFVGPATWTAVSLAQGANDVLPGAGPVATVAFAGAGGPMGFPGGMRSGIPGGFQSGGPGGFGAPPTSGFAGSPPGFLAGTRGAQQPNGKLSQANRQLVAYLEAHQGSTRYLFATLSSQLAAPYIIATGKSVMTLGGFSGGDQILTLSQLQALIRGNQVRYFLLDGGRGGFGGPGGASGNAQLAQWVESHGTLVPASDYGGSSAGGAQLYVVSSAAGA